MTKNEFIRHFEAIQSFYDDQKDLGYALHKRFLNGHSVVVFGDGVVKTVVEMLSELSGIETDLIDWLLYEDGGTIYYGEDHKEEFLIVTAEDLWEAHERGIV
jgi:hypothetical protein